MRNIWLVNHYTPHPMKRGNAALHLQLAMEMRKNNWNVQIVSASTSHPAGEQFLQKGETASLVTWNDTETLLVRARPYRSDGGGRWINMAEFGSRLFLKRSLSDLSEPELIIGRITNPLAATAALRWARRFRVPFVLEISDIWPDTFIQLGAWSKSGLKSRALSKLERYLIRHSSAVMSPLPGVGKYLEDSDFHHIPFYWVPNGVDPARPYYKAENARQASDGFRFMYTGALGYANAVDTIIEAFDRYVGEHNDSKSTLEIIGAGTLFNELQDQAARGKSRKQIAFTGRIPADQIPERLRHADALVANMRSLPLYRYGIALNKLFEYMSAARPIIFASDAMNNLVREAGAGITVPADDGTALADAMHEMVQSDTETRRAWGNAGRQYVLGNYTYAHAADRFYAMVKDLVG